MKTKQQKRKEALARFKVRGKKPGETEAEYDLYLGRKQVERESLQQRTGSRI